MNKAIRILCGDAADVLRSVPDASVALTVTSPPYYLHRDYGVEGQIGQEPSLEAYLARIGAVLRQILRVTDEHGSCFMVVGDTYLDRRLLLVPHRIGILASDIDWVVRNDVIWHKTSPPPESPRNRWRSGHEHVLFLAKNPSGYRFNADAVRVPHSPATVRRWGSGQKYGGSKSQGRRSANDSRMRHGQSFRLNPLGCLPIDVWSCAGANSSASHYAAFPEQLVRTIIEACSMPGDTVLDPFAGSGTTCSVAAGLGRRCIGIDLNPEYARMAAGAAGSARMAA
jgi:DNA modification methylase